MLPSFEKPPIAEVAIGVQFAHNVALRTLDYADVWAEFGKDDYPTYAEVPPLAPLAAFGQQTLINVDLPFMPPTPRYWFQSKDENGLIQLQANRLIYNWRQSPAGNRPYPRYESVVENFFKNYAIYSTFVSTKGHAVLPQLAEIAYVNIVTMGQDGFDEIGDILNGSFNLTAGPALPKPTGVQFAWQHYLSELNTFLNVTVTSLQAQEVPAVRIEISAFGPVDASNGADAVATLRAWFDDVRGRIVTLFKDITTTKAHQVWGLKA